MHTHREAIFMVGYVTVQGLSELLRDIKKREKKTEMNVERALDIAISFVCFAILGVLYWYPDSVWAKEPIYLGLGIVIVICLILAVRDGRVAQGHTRNENTDDPSMSGLITELVLLSEEDTELMAWNLYGKTAALIGRAGKGSEADIDLSSGPYASMVDKEHAVLNYSAGDWYVEDLGSKNGLSVKKGEDGKIYRLSADSLCKLEKGDCLYVGMNRLLLR